MPVKVKGLDARKVVAAAALCVAAITLALFVVHRANAPVRIPAKYDFRRYGPGGPPDPNKLPPGSMPGGH